MGILSILLMVLFIISALLLVALVLIQDEGGEGLGGIFGGGGSQQVGNRSGNILTKTTGVLGAIFLFSSFGLAWLNRTPETGDIERAARELEGEVQPIEWWLVPADEDPADDGFELFLDPPAVDESEE